MSIQVDEYVPDDGSGSYRRWFARLDVQSAAKVTVALLRLSQGNTAALKSLSGGLSEMRIDWGPGLRIYLAQDGDALVVLFGGGTKRSQQADIRKARELLAESKARKLTARSGKPRRGK